MNGQPSAEQLVRCIPDRSMWRSANLNLIELCESTSPHTDTHFVKVLTQTSVAVNVHTTRPLSPVVMSNMAISYINS